MNVQSYKNAMDRIKADDSCRERILAAKPRRKKIRPITAFPVIAAAFTLIMGTVVCAAQLGLFEILFSTSDKPAGSEQLSCFEQITGEMDIHSLTTHYDGAEVTPVGYAADSYKIYCVFRIDLDTPVFSDYKYYEEQYIDGWGHYSVELSELFQSFSDDNTSGGRAGVRYIKEDDDTFYCIYTILCYDEMHGTIPLKLTCFNLSGVYFNEQNIIAYDQIIPENIFSAEFSVDIPETEPLKIGNDSLSFYVTPCGITAEAVGSELDKLLSLRTDSQNNLLSGKAYIRLKNGEEIRCLSNVNILYGLNGNSFEGRVFEIFYSDNTQKGTTYHTQKGTFHTTFEYPIDPEQTEYIYVGGRKYYPE